MRLPAKVLCASVHTSAAGTFGPRLIITSGTYVPVTKIAVDKAAQRRPLVLVPVRSVNCTVCARELISAKTNRTGGIRKEIAQIRL
jgi:hypothetical protein